MRRLASLRLTCVALALLAACITGSQLAGGAGRAWMAIPLVLLAINLLAAVLTRGALRRQRPLMLFHIALMALCALAAIEAMLEFDGRLELTEGQSFDRRDLRAVRGELRSTAPPDAARIEQGPIDASYAQGLSRQRSSSILHVDGEARMLHDGAPLSVDGLRFSVSANKGFAVVLAWRDAQGAVQVGSLNMPSYPAMEWRQIQYWTTPSGERVQVSLDLPSRPVQDWSLRALLPKAQVRLHRADGVLALRPGVPVRLGGGSLELLSVRLWMGYRVDHQPLLGLMLLCALGGIGALAWHVMRVHFIVPDPAAPASRAPRTSGAPVERRVRSAA